MKMKGTITSTTKDFPKPCVIEATQNGFNFKYRGITYAFYYGDKPTGYSKMVAHREKTEVYKFHAGAELQLIMAMPEIKEYLESVPEEKPNPKIVHKKQTGTQSCIDHINRKIEVITRDQSRMNNQVLMLLKELVKELHQYL